MTTNSNASRIALITGASRGLGRSAALHLADAGVDVVLTYLGNESAAQQVVAAVREKGRRAAALRLDMGDSASFPAFASKLRAILQQDFGRGSVNYLVNNAGTGEYASFAETTEAQLDAMYQIHLKGTFLLTQALLPVIADGGRILNTSSGLTRFTLPGYAAYAAMKGGVEVLTRFMAKELGGRGIAVNTIAPGAIETDFGGGAVRDNADLNAMIAQQTALGRVGLPDDIGAAVASLLSDSNGWLNAQRVEVSGGIAI
jgi:NAD(P)-dependent dehydrogenase (short-subunit alcohol dehydrogenase family)